MEQISTAVPAQESSPHPRPAAATVTDVMQLPPTTVQQHDHAAAAAYLERYSKPHVIEKKKSARAASNASW